jgi:ubiquinone/menaquinone biosynthesis C-methylase UbiE
MAWFARKSKKTQRGPRARVILVSSQSQRRGLFGRLFLAEAPYLLPSDDAEVNRLDFQHFMLRYALRGNFLAPLRNPRSILDVGCGTGRWVREIAGHFPAANVVGVDIAPPPEASASGPAYGANEPRLGNYAMVQADVMQDLPFADTTFDFVHQRLLFLAIPTAQWPRLMTELVRVTRRGGWVELVEGSAVPPESGPAMQMWGQWLSVASAKRGIDFAQGSQIGQHLMQAGLDNVRQHEVRMQAGRQFGRLGAMLEANYMGILHAVKPQIVAAGMTAAESYDAAIAAIRGEIAEGRCFWHAYIAYGQRLQA